MQLVECADCGRRFNPRVATKAARGPLCPPCAERWRWKAWREGRKAAKRKQGEAAERKQREAARARGKAEKAFEAHQHTGGIAYAGFWKRFAAAFIDGLVLSVGSVLVGFLWGFAGAIEDPAEVEGMAAVLGVLLGWVYFAVMESSPTQGTLGKMALGMRVTDLNGHRVGFGRATGRYFAKIVSAIILYVGFLIAAFTEKKQALHDMIAGCLVLDGRPGQTGRETGGIPGTATDSWP